MQNKSWQLWPSKQQWERWSLPSKLTFIGAYVGIVALLITVCFFIIDSFETSTQTERSERMEELITNTFVSDRFKESFDNLAALDTDIAYNELSDIVKNFPVSYAAKQAIIIKTMISAAEVAAYHELLDKIYSKGLHEAVSENDKQKFPVLFWLTGQKIRKWSQNLLYETEMLISFTEEEIYLKINCKPNSQDLYKAVTSFNKVNDKIKRGNFPSQDELTYHERTTRYIYISNTIGKTLGVEALPFKTGFLAKWKEAELEGKVNWIELLSLCGASLVASGLTLRAQNETSIAIEVYERANELSKKTLELYKSKLSPDRKTILETTEQICDEALQELRAFANANNTGRKTQIEGKNMPTLKCAKCLKVVSTVMGIKPTECPHCGVSFVDRVTCQKCGISVTRSKFEEAGNKCPYCSNL